MKFEIALLIIFTTAGCVSTSQFRGPDGEKNYLTKCNGTARSMASCFNEASDKCGDGGYNILGSKEEQCFTTNLANGNPVPTMCRQLLFTCKERETASSSPDKPEDPKPQPTKISHASVPVTTGPVHEEQESEEQLEWDRNLNR